MAQLFGNSFYRENDDKPTALWISAIQRFTDEQISRGLANLANDNLIFPANLSMFVSACKREVYDASPRRLGVEYKALTHDEEQANADKAWDQMEALAGTRLRPDH